MKLEFPVEKTVKSRRSVRTYKDLPISSETLAKFESYIGTLSNPFGASVTFRMLESNTAVNKDKLGTYGMITGAKKFFGASVKQSESALQGMGYEFEKLILYAESLGLGTCWLGGTFNRSEFAKAMSVNENDLFPAISPLGYATVKKSVKESLVRKSIKADQRKPWDMLFFNQSFASPLTAEIAGAYAFPLEMTRLAPSASNKQPWRIVKDGDKYHFYEEKAPGYSDRLGFDVQRIDLGISACHFHLAAIEKDLPGKFEVLAAPQIDVPQNVYYLFSWVAG